MKGLEAKLRTLKADLKKAKWGEGVQAWSKSYKAAVMDRMDVLHEELSGLKTGFDEVEGEGKAVKACRKGSRGLDSCIGDLERTRKALEGADPILDARWVYLKTQDVERMADECRQSAAKAKEACAAAEEEGMPLWIPIAGGGAVLLVLAGVGFWLWRRRR